MPIQDPHLRARVRRSRSIGGVPAACFAYTGNTLHHGDELDTAGGKLRSLRNTENAKLPTSTSSSFSSRRQSMLLHWTAPHKTSNSVPTWGAAGNAGNPSIICGGGPREHQHQHAVYHSRDSPVTHHHLSTTTTSHKDHVNSQCDALRYVNRSDRQSLLSNSNSVATRVPGLTVENYPSSPVLSSSQVHHQNKNGDETNNDCDDVTRPARFDNCVTVTTTKTNNAELIRRNSTGLGSATFGRSSGNDRTLLLEPTTIDTIMSPTKSSLIQSIVHYRNGKKNKRWFILVKYTYLYKI